MRVTDFEKAIDGLNCGIEIERMRVRPGQGVTRVIARHGEEVLMWDEFGRCFSAGNLDVEGSGLELLGSLSPDGLERDVNYDLKFE